MPTEFLITVKAYPEASKKYGEAVCVAGLRLGVLQPPTWVRLYPIQFRELPGGKQFHKYDVVQLDTQPSRDSRPESLHPVESSIAITGNMAQRQRREVLQQVERTTTCDLRVAQEPGGAQASLGMIKPIDIDPLVVVPLTDEEIDDRRKHRAETLSQLSLLEERPQPAEVIPYDFKYSYRCGHRECGGHSQKIVDWEIVQAYRKWRQTYGHDPVPEICEKWNSFLSSDRDLHLYVGNMAAWRKNFLVLGLYAPVIASAH